ncbi:hypothetical protein [Streptomyces qaidamensis]|nr:hypothetical protein [Streptomyces qaidamensis]
MHWPLYGPAGVPLEVVLGDVKALATLVLHHAAPEEPPLAGVPGSP